MARTSTRRPRGDFLRRIHLKPNRSPTVVWLGLALAGLLATSPGCARSLATLDSARGAFSAGDLAAARASLVDLAEGSERYADVAALDLAVVELAAGKANAAETRLRTLRDEFDRRGKGLQSLASAASMVSDDTVRRFEPASYELVMIRAMLSICSLAGDASDAEAYALQAAMKQAEFARVAEESGRVDVADVFQPLALAPYVRGMLRESSHRDYDDAVNAYRMVSHLRPSFAPAAEDIRRAGEGVHSRPGHGVLYVIACVGRGPVLAEVVAPTTTRTLGLASAILRDQGKSDDNAKGDFVLPSIASVKIPKVVIPESRTGSVGVWVNRRVVGRTHTLTDTANLAVRQNEAELPWTIARAVARRATKETLVAGVGHSLGLEGNAAEVFRFAAASAWGLSERADTRCWGMLPREIQVLRTELLAGEHSVQVHSLGAAEVPQSPNHPANAPLAGAPRLEETQASGPRSDVRRVSIVDGGNSYLVVFATDHAVFAHAGNR